MEGSVALAFTQNQLPGPLTHLHTHTHTHTHTREERRSLVDVLLNEGRSESLRPMEPRPHLAHVLLQSGGARSSLHVRVGVEAVVHPGTQPLKGAGSRRG